MAHSAHMLFIALSRTVFTLNWFHHYFVVVNIHRIIGMRQDSDLHTFLARLTLQLLTRNQWPAAFCV